ASIRIVGSEVNVADPPPQARPDAAGCDLGESEEKVREVVSAIGDLGTRNRNKSEQINRRFTDLLDRYMQPAADLGHQGQERRRHEFCRTMDELLAELAR